MGSEQSGAISPELVERTDRPAGLTVVQFNMTYEGFGLILDFLSHHPPFADFAVKTLAEAIRRQLHLGHHQVAIEAGTIVGYAGWLLTSEAIGSAWLAGRGNLVPIDPTLADAAALTTVAVREPAAVLPLMRGARDLNPGKRIFFKRDGEGRTRKGAVINRLPGM